MSLGDLLGVARNVQDIGNRQQEILGAQSLSQATKQNTDPVTGQTDYTGVARDIVKMPGRITPERQQAIIAAGQAQQDRNVSKATEVTKILGGLAALGDKITPETIDHAQVQITAILGKDSARFVHDLFEGAHSAPEIQKRIVMFQSAYNQLPELTTVPTQAGPVQIPRAQATIAAERGGLPASAPEYEKELRAAQADAGTFLQETAPLEHAIPALSRLGPRGIGPTTAEFNHFRSFLHNLGVEGIDMSRVQDFEEVRKYFVNWANQQTSGQTNDRLAAAFAGNPNVKMTQAAALDVAKTALTLRRMKQAGYIAFTKTGLAPSAFPQWYAKWQSQQDPAAFGVDLMTTEARSKFVAGLKGDPKDLSTPLGRFNASWKAARDSNVERPNIDWNNERGGR
jgi:hypothetical protein